MTEIIKLELSGIRSFAKNSANASQAIEFNGPVTIITGDNGTGKTTIIEALKFALTGKSCREIITDPKFWQDKEVKSNIELKIKLCDGILYSIKLNPTFTQNKRNEISYSNGAIKVCPLNGSSDIVFPIKKYQQWIEPKLGVSSSIIENVIFCSQNDSCWPIDLHGDDLKTKFDQFFDLKIYDELIDKIQEELNKLKKRSKSLDNLINEQKPKADFYLQFKKEAYDHEKQIEMINEELAMKDDQINLLEKGKEYISRIILGHEQIDKLLPKELKKLINTEDDSTSFLSSFQNAFDESNEKIEQLKSTCIQKQNHIKKFEEMKKYEEQFNKSTENIQNLLQSIKDKTDDGEITEANFDKKISSKESNFSEEKDKLFERKYIINSELLSAKRDIEKYTALCSHQKEESKEIKDEISKILTPKSDESYSDAYESKKKILNIEKANLERTKNMIDIFIKFKETAEKCHCCPLCKQNFPSIEKLRSFIDEDLSEYISPQQETMKKYQDNQDCIDQLLSIKSKIDKYENSQKEINNFEANIEKGKQKVESFSSDLLKIENDLNEIKEKIKGINILSKDAILLKQEINNQKNYLDEKEKIKIDIGDFNSDLLESLENEVYEINMQIKELNSSQLTKDQLEEYKKIRCALIEDRENLILFGDQLMRFEIDISKDDYDYDKVNQLINNKNIEKARSLEKLANEQRSLSKANSFVEQYKESFLEYKNSIIKNEFQKKVISDLTRYKRQIEELLIQFHLKKIEEINDTIYYLWSRIYQGSDITSIRIDYREKKVDEPSDGKKKFDYLVMMKKDNVDLDMFNRCSSGQKMLASIIIRIALMQTFCSKCGIIALDEPTTNLDKKNRKELANQLVEIANLKRDDCDDKKKNFHLIVISHNKKFVEPIRSELGLDRYYYLKREVDENKNHYSKIEVLKF